MKTLIRHRCRDAERGSSVVAFSILAPVAIFMILGIVQVAIVGHVRHVATLAASAGVAEAAAFDGTSSDGQQRAEAQLSEASGWVEDPVVTASRSTTEATVSVTADAFTILPFGDWHVRVQRTQPVERPED